LRIGEGFCAGNGLPGGAGIGGDQQLHLLPVQPLPTGRPADDLRPVPGLTSIGGGQQQVRSPTLIEACGVFP
jgi:hypothetical protein